MMRKTSFLLILAFLSQILLPRATNADGFVLSKLGRYVPEKSQDAFIEYSEGRERLYLSIRVEESDESTLWVVPVPAQPQSVSAEPVEEYPRVVLEKSPAENARRVLKDALVSTFLLDTGLAAIPVLMTGTIGRYGSATFGRPGEDVDVHQHVEKLGMVVEVLTANSSEALEKYLVAKELDVKVSELSSLQEYIEKDFSLICGWSASPISEVRARALRIEFPTEKVFYPLRPSRVYDSPIETSIYVRGFFEPESSDSSFRCRYLYGKVDIRKVEENPKRLAITFAREMKRVAWEPITRVDLTQSPKGWTDDVLLVLGAPAAVHVATWIDRLRSGWMLSIILQLVLGPIVALIVLPQAFASSGEIRREDELWAMIVGVGSALSLLVSSLFFVAWRYRCRSQGSWKELRAMLKVKLLPVLIFCCFLLLLGFVMACNEEGLARGGLITIFLFFPSLLMLLLATAIVLLLKELEGRKAAWLIAFALGHLASSFLLCAVLLRWLSVY